MLNPEIDQSILRGFSTTSWGTMAEATLVLTLTCLALMLIVHLTIYLVEDVISSMFTRPNQQAHIPLASSSHSDTTENKSHD